MYQTTLSRSLFRVEYKSGSCLDAQGGVLEIWGSTAKFHKMASFNRILVNILKSC